ncbi:MAG: hypothetical protein U0411_11930 [Thermodesulfovibrionales bacterium]
MAEKGTGLLGRDALVQEAIQDPRKINGIISSLYDEDMEQRFVAAKALGELARIMPDRVSRKWRRIFEAFDDTMSCWGIAEAMGEIARNIPGLRGRISLRLRKFQRDECTCQGYLWAVCRIGQVDMEKVRDWVPDLVSALESKNVCIVGQAVWALGELGIGQGRERIRALLGDARETWLYENDAVLVKKVGTIAAEALAKLEEPFR